MMFPSINETHSNCASTWKHDHQLLAKDPHWQHHLPAFTWNSRFWFQLALCVTSYIPSPLTAAEQTVLKAWADNTEEDWGHFPFPNGEFCITSFHIVFIGMTIFEYWLIKIFRHRQWGNPIIVGWEWLKDVQRQSNFSLVWLEAHGSHWQRLVHRLASDHD